MRLAELPYLKA